MDAMAGGTQVAKWTRWIEDEVRRGVVTMYFHRQVWRGVQKIIEDNGSLPDSAYWAYHFDVYAATQAVAVRRQADRDHRVASLGRLIEEIRDEPSRLTLDWWLGLWGPDEWDREFASGRWATDFAGDVGEHIDPAIPAVHLEQLTRAAESVKRYVDTHIAHAEDFERDQAPPRPPGFTLDELDKAIDTIGNLFRRYMDLLKCTDFSLEVQMYPDWLAPFEVPWIPSGPGGPTSS
jgi:hypothetical protein